MQRRDGKQLNAVIRPILNHLYKQRSLLMVLSVMVVFVASYLLILPALTLEKNEAAKQGGIDVPKTEQGVDSGEIDQRGIGEIDSEAPESDAGESAEAEAVTGEDGTGEAAGELSFEGEGYQVSVAVDAKSGLPQDTQLTAEEITSEDEDYDAWRDEALKAVQEIEGDKQVSDLKFAKFYDISLISGDGEIEPAAPVDVNISYDKALKVSDADHLRIVHFVANEKGELVPEVLDPKDVQAEVKKGKMSSTAFAAESFSVYGIVYTVDFHYEVDGKTFDYSIEGGSSIKLSELFAALSIDVDVEEVADVAFSDPSLIEIAAEDGDWTLKSLKAFDTEESLTVTMVNGDSFVVRVTDGQKSDMSLLEEGGKYVLYIVYRGDYYTLNSDGDTVQVLNNDLDNLDSEYLWTYKFKPQADDPSQDADGCSWANGSNYLDVYWSFEDRGFSNNYNPVAPSSGGWEPVAKLISAGDGGFYFTDVNDEERYLYYDSGNTHIRTCHVSAHQQYYSNAPDPVSVHIYKQETTYNVTCSTDNAEYGNVRYTHNGNTQQTTAQNTSFVVTTAKNDSDNKQVPDSITAVPSEGYKFTGWTVINDGWSEYEVVDWGEGCTAESATIRPTVNGDVTLQASFAPERLYQLTVKTNNNEMGTVGGGDLNGVTVSNQNSFKSISTVVINNVGKNAYELTATKKPLHKFVKWELRTANGALVGEYTTPTIDARSLNLTEDNMTLTAVFAKKTETEIDNEDINTLLENWKQDLTGDFVGVDKTAHVHDYENRIYEIDLSASSGKWAVERSINLDFITDTSRSMYFPANLETIGTTRNLNNWFTRNGVEGETYYVISNDDSATMYAVYKVGNEWKCKDSSYYYYIKAGTGTSNTEYDIQNNLTVGTRISTGVIYKSSDPTYAYATGHTPPDSLTEYWSRLDYLYKAVMTATNALKTIDPNSKVHLTTFNKQSDNEGLLGSTEQEIYAKLQNISPMGGTRQDRGLWTARTGTDIGRLNDYDYPDTTTGPGQNSVFKNNSANQQFAIIVTDGAPNGAHWDDSGSIYDQADALKAITDSSGKNLTLMTLGIGSDFVGDNKAKFDSLASEPKYAENANNGGEIVRAIQDLVRSMVKKAELFGTVSDTLDPAFYPVDENDNPINPGYYKNGQPYTPSANDTSKYYRWSKDGEVWTITYYNQTFEWPEKDGAGNITENGWEQSFYVKAKENFLGGNTIETNGGTSFTATHTILLDDNGHERPETKKEIKNSSNVSSPIIKNDIPTPHVNIKQLTLDQNETKWTVYTETSVNPLPQIKELFNNIKVLEVVEDSTDNMITTNTAMLFDPGEGTTPETFLLKDAITLTDANWDDLIGVNGGDGTVDIPYTKYDHTPGVIRLTLTKTGETADYSEHPTSSSPNAVEEYVLTAQFIPYTVEEMRANDSDGGAYHTTKDKSPGTVQQGGRPSINKHIIDLFTRGISITKTDENFINGLPGAEFMVYRPATEEEISSSDPAVQVKIKTFDGDSTKYYADHELDFDEQGVAYKNGVKAYGENTKYYLVETKAPAGYNMLEEPVPVQLTITDTYTLMPVEEGSQPVTQTTKPVTGMYNWQQMAKLELLSESGVIRTTGAYNPDDPSTDLTHTAIEPSSRYEMMYYRIANNPGYELPSAGGPGTTWIYLIGSILLLACSTILIARRRVGKMS